MKRIIQEETVKRHIMPMVFETKYYICQCVRLWSNPKKGTNYVRCLWCQSMCPKAFEAKDIKIRYKCQDCGHTWHCRELIWGENYCRCGQTGIPDRALWNDLYYVVSCVSELIRKKLADKHDTHDWNYFYTHAIDKVYNKILNL